MVCMGLHNMSHKKLCPVFFSVLCSTWLGLSVCTVSVGVSVSVGSKGMFSHVIGRETVLPTPMNMHQYTLKDNSVLVFVSFVALRDECTVPTCLYFY